MPEPLLEILTTNLEIEPRGVYRVDGPLNLGRLRQLTSLARPDLKDRPFLGQTPPGFVSKDVDFFAAIQS
jgi:polyphosphate kinase